MKNQNSFGFTIVELLVAVFISSLVIAGAFNIQMVFNRSVAYEEEVSDMQNSLDALRAYLRRTFKLTGAGLAQRLAYYDCSKNYHIIPSILIHNNNSYPVINDTSSGDPDNDPDWIEMIVPSNVVQTSVKDILNGRYARVYITTDFHKRNVVGVNVGNTSCLFRLNQVYNSSSNKYLYWNYKAGIYCMNPPNKQHLACGITNTNVNPSQTVSITNLGEFPFQALRIDTTNPLRPMLMHGVKRLENGGNLYTWSPIAENIEDMQIAYHIDYSNPPDNKGDLWIIDRDLTFSEQGRVRALRITVIARTLQPLGNISTRRPAAEDHQIGAWDKYKRRSMTMVIQLPNVPILGGTL